MQKSFAGIALAVLVLASGTVGCDSISRADKSLPVKETPAAAPTSPASKSSPFAAMEQSIHQQVNQYRQSRGLPPLTLDDRISQQARAHSQAMASGRVPFSHQGVEERFKAIGKSISYRAAAENVAFNQGYTDPVTQAVQGWIDSPGHRHNMEGKYELTGIGIAKNAKGEYYFTQLFIKRR